jgi:hypothetical protein
LKPVANGLIKLSKNSGFRRLCGFSVVANSE